MTEIMSSLRNFDAVAGVAMETQTSGVDLGFKRGADLTSQL